MITAEVYLWGTRIGAVAQEDHTSIPMFNYDKNFQNSGIEVSPIVMPLSALVYSFPALSKETFYGLPGLLSDSLVKLASDILAERENIHVSEDEQTMEQIINVGTGNHDLLFIGINSKCMGCVN